MYSILKFYIFSKSCITQKVNCTPHLRWHFFMAVPIRRKIDYWQLVISENDLSYIKTLEGPEYRFRKIDLVMNEFTEHNYVQTQLSPIQKTFTKQLNLFIDAGIHPAIARFVGFSYIPNHLVFTKYYVNKTLSHLLKDIRLGNSHAEWDSTMKSICVFGIVSALAHLHEIFDDIYPDFSIRYFCPENIVFNSKFEPKLVNFEYGDEKFDIPNAYIPPELHENTDVPRYGEDIWAFGMVLYEILTGKIPYEGKSEDEIKISVINGDIPELPPPSKETDDIIGIIQNCLEKDPNNRPELYIIFAHILNLKNELFPGTDKEKFELYKSMVVPFTVISKDGLEYMKHEDEEENEPEQ